MRSNTFNFLFAESWKFIALILLFTRCAPGEAPAQDFEGTLHFTMKTVITDPELRKQQEQQLQEARKNLTGPEMEKSIREMESQMQNSDFQKQMEKSPELKKMMETQIEQLKKMRQNALADPSSHSLEQVSAIKMTMKIKDGNVLSYSGGLALDMLGGNIVTLCRSSDKKCYQLDTKNKTYHELTSDPSSTAKQDWVYKIQPLAGDSIILEFSCRKYSFEMVNSKEKISMRGYLWASEALQFPVLNTVWQRDPSMGAVAGIKGMPLYMEMDASAQHKMIYALDAVQKEKLNAAEFTIPAGYRKE